jgi:tetratricopeptide (TPR) repeat protein/serine/threonine protein kinase
MSDAGRNVKAIFGEALDCASPAEQAAYLDRACGGDPALRARVEALLRAHQRAGHFLEGAPAPAEGSPAEAAGTALGPYRLLEPLGEGGFGIVYRAEQQQPVRRLVALKALRPGMDSKQVIARFEAERQALALMNHPNIARVLDAGEAPPAYAGGPPRPYVVLELVEGVPLTDFCDRERLTPRERLGLFLSVCQAVQHAHQKGIIHRDLKPSNILVSRQDGRPVVKVIDFGIAKALDQRLTDKTLVTGVAQVVGTPLYMSPEQAEPGAADVDTRSDLYALGVLLYELLTGTTPFDRERLREASFDELRRIIREEEPPRPSARVSTLGPAAATLSERRRIDPRQLGQLLRGELDWVVMKCLEKDRTRRYETADALARDVGRYLADEPVEACPPSAGYRLGKFLRKQRRPLLTAAAFLVLLAAAGVLAGGQAVREARAERDRAVEQAKRDGAVRDALEQARTLRAEARQERDAGKWARAREQAERAQALVESGPVDAALAAQVRQVHDDLEAEEKDRRLVADLEAARLAQAETVAGENRFAFERALPRYREAFRAYGLPVGEGDPAAAVARLLRRPPEVRQAVAAALDEWIGMATDPHRPVREPHLDWLRALAAAQVDRGGMPEMQAAWQEQDPTRRREALERLAATVDPSRWPATTLMRLYWRLEAVQATPSAVRLLRRAWPQHAANFWVNENLGLLLRDTEPPDRAGAVRHLAAAVALRPDSAGAHLNLGKALEEDGQRDEAITCFRRALELDPKYVTALAHLGFTLTAKGRVDEAIACCHRALELDPEDASAHRAMGEALCDGKRDYDGAIACFHKALALNPNFAEAQCDLGVALAGKGREDEAIGCFHKALALNPKLANAHYCLGDVLRQKGQADEAIACFRRAIELDPKHVSAYLNLGWTLRDRGRISEAIVCYLRALDLDPNNAVTHQELGLALMAGGQRDEAIAHYRRALELNPGSAQTHINLGTALFGKGLLEEAGTSFRRAIELDRKDPFGPYDLGMVLDAQGRVDEAIACYRRALELDPQFAKAHCNLGLALRGKGEFRAALAEVRTGHELGSRRPGWPHPSAEWVKQCERLVQLDDLLTATREGKARPAGPAECVELADFCRFLKQCPAAAVRFYTEAFTAEPKLAADPQAAHRYRAAQAAALAGCGQGDGAGLDAAERARLRRQALEWLRADLDLGTQELKMASPKTGEAVVARMQQWRSEPSLAGVRDAPALAALPAEERSRWQAFWADVAAARTRAGEAQKPAEKQPPHPPEK